jgi:hypothetical protein
MAGKPRTPEFQGGHPKSKNMKNIANPTPGVVVGSQAAKKIEFPAGTHPDAPTVRARKPEFSGGQPKSRSNGNVPNGRPRD